MEIRYANTKTALRGISMSVPVVNIREMRVFVRYGDMTMLMVMRLIIVPSEIVRVAASSVKHVSKRWSGFGEFARKAPYFSGALILLVGFYVGYQGLHALA